MNSGNAVFVPVKAQIATKSFLDPLPVNPIAIITKFEASKSHEKLTFINLLLSILRAKMNSRYRITPVMSTRRAAQSSTEHMRLNENESAELTTPSSLSPASYSSQIPSYASDPDLTPAQMRHDCCSASDHPWPSDIESPCLLDYRFASHTPPITKATLSEIDLDSLFTNLLLRHDLNFDPKIQYRPTIRGIKDGSGVTEALKYWNAIGFEVAGLFVAKGFSSVCGSSHCCCCTSLRGDKGSLQTRLMRLPSMFETVREILKDLLKDCLSIDEWLVIDTRLDIDLLVQELENDTCDLVALSDWLGALLRRFCSPERHHLVDLMVFEVHHGVRSANTTEVRNGLMRIFSILETMKLVSLHQVCQ